MYLSIIFVFMGLLGLGYGSNLLISSGKNVARHFGISYFFFGLAFVSVGTSLPEIAVTIAGAIDRLQGLETSGIVMGDKLGSALVNITLFLGIFALFTTLKLKREEIFKQSVPLLGSILLFFLLASDGYLSRKDAAIFLFFYVVYYYLIAETEKIRASTKKTKLELAKDITFALFGLGLLLLSSKLVVENSVKLAEFFQINQTIIGIFILGIGTGLPEFSVMVMSIRQKTIDLSLGDLLGSNIVDLLLATGLGAMISEFIVDKKLIMFDIPFLFVATLLTLLFFYYGKNVSRKEGIVLLLIFFGYGVIKLMYMS